MAGQKTAVYVAALTCVGFLCLILASAAIGIPIWGYFDNPSGSWEGDRGYFGPWTICKRLSFYRELCGPNISSFQPSLLVFISGILAVVSTISLVFFCILSILQIAMISSREKILIKYNILIIIKLALSLVASLLAIASAVLFAFQIDDRSKNGFIISRGVSFYLQIAVVVCTIGLFVMAIYDITFSRRIGGDPTAYIDTSATTATTYNNPGFRERRLVKNVSVTDSSGKPYSGMNDGSVASMSTTLTSVSNGSTVESITRSPLRSSLKKPRPPPVEGFGIPNPGFSGTSQSPPPHRNGSTKKVRIQTHSTDV